MVTHSSSILAWGTLWTEEPGGLEPVGSQSQTQLKRHSPRACTAQGILRGPEVCRETHCPFREDVASDESQAGVGENASQ